MFLQTNSINLRSSAVRFFLGTTLTNDPRAPLPRKIPLLLPSRICSHRDESVSQQKYDTKINNSMKPMKYTKSMPNHRGKIMYRGIIQSDPRNMMGKPVIAGTRITVELILEKLAAGETIEQILEAHPRLTRKAIQAALAGG